MAVYCARVQGYNHELVVLRRYYVSCCDIEAILHVYQGCMIVDYLSRNEPSMGSSQHYIGERTSGTG